MKSLVALLDRKKRANTLIPAPLPSSLSPTASVPQDKLAPSFDNRCTAPSDLLRPPVPRHRATSNPNLPRYPHLYEPLAQPRTQSPAHSIAYHNDPDDDTLADPFAAASPIKPKSALLPPTSFRPLPPRAPIRRGSSPNLGNTAPQEVFQTQQPIRNTRAERNSTVTPRIASQTSSETGADSNDSAPISVHGTAGKGRWLRERRSLSNLFRPQAAVSTGPVPQLPPFPTGIPERKSSFFKRARSGSTPVATQGSEWAHTPHRLSAAPASVPVRSQMPLAPQLRSANREPARPAPETPSTAGSTTPESWVRVGGVSLDQGSPISPTNARRRALSVPAKPPRPTELAPPIPSPQFVPSASPSKSSTFKVAPKEVLPTPRPELPSDRRVRSSRSTHGLRSASVSVSNSHDAGCGPLEANLRRRLSLKHFKQSSTSTSEGGHGSDSIISVGKAVRKSALKRTSEQTCRGPLSRQDNRTTVAVSTTSTSHMSAAHQDVSDHRPKAEVTGRRRPVGGVLQATSSVVGANDSPLDSPRTPLSASSTSSIGNILRGHGLAPSDSRTLPVLDNIWGSFVSETAFGSLPPSPSDSIMGRNRVTKLQSSASRRQTIESTNSPETPRGLPRRRQWNLDLPPPSSPPVVELPPTPIGQSPAMALPLGSVERRKLSRSPSKRGMLLTPPISPTEELEIQGLDALLSASNSDNSLLASSYNSSSVSSINSRDLPSRLVRSASSPVIRSPESPVLSVVSDKNSRSWLSVDLPRLDSIAPLSRSQTSSQRTPVPGTPIASPFSIGDPDLAYLGASSGTPTLILSIPRSESGHVGVPNELTQNDTQLRYPSFPSVPMEDSDINLSMFPAVPLGIFKPNGREMNRGGTCGETRPANWSEESLLTPPITPAWFAQAFDTPSDDEQEGIKTGETKDGISLAELGGFVSIRRRNHVKKAPSDSSNGSSLDGTLEPDMSLSRRSDWRSKSITISEKRMGRKF